ncbi:MAG: hypothetical protein ACYSWU_11785 [Planctomycetota bacterium]|jgi:hypothetical protein
MGWAEKTLIVVLRVSAVILLVALVPAVMPFAWMVAIHRGLGLGKLPEGPIVGYLTRSLSALYAAHGALVLFVSFDVRRYLPVIKCLAVLNVAFGAGMLTIDCTVGLPRWWIACEGPPLIVLGAAMFLLAAATGRRMEKADG